MKSPNKGPTTSKNLSGSPVVGTRKCSGQPLRVVQGTAKQMDRSTNSGGKGAMKKR